MSAQAGSTGAIVLGVVIAIVGIATQNYQLLVPAIMLIAGGAVGLAFQPEVSSPKGAKARQLELATSSEGFPIPVIFGEQKIPGNFMEYKKEHFRSVKIYGQPSQGGGKGGGSDDVKGVVGFDYYLQFEYGLCMGPIDSCGQVWSSPGEIPMRPTSPLTQAEFAPGQDYIEFSLTGHQEGGLVRLWQGNATQTRVNPNGSDKYVQDYITGVGVVSGGANYSANTKGTVVGDGTGAEVALVIQGGVIQSVRVTKRGYGYTAATITLTSAGAGAGASFSVNVGLTTMNYRNVCYALFGPGNGFKIGRFPQPKSYLFVLRRLPRPTRDNGTTIPELRVRGSYDATKPGYYQANPAAMMYEIMTNRLWGRGLSSDLINEDSFVAASEYFSDRHIGLSYTLDSADKITELLDILRTHLRTIIIWDGETMKMRVLMDPAETKRDIQTVTDQEVVGLRVVRPDWIQTFNELRAEFNNAQRNYRPDVIHVMDSANIALLGGRINPVRINLPAFTDFNIAWKQCQRMLREYTYPLATAGFQMNMFRSQLEVGDTFRLIWEEYGTGKQTAYFTVLKKSEASGGKELIDITAIEDIDISPVDAEELEITVPDKQPWEQLPDLDVNRVGLFVIPGTTNEAISPVTAIELPAIITQGKAQTIFLGEAGNDGIVGFEVHFKQEGNQDFRFLENIDSFAITGVLITAIEDAFAIDRRPEGAFDFALTNVERNEADLLGSATLVQEDTDSMETLIDSGRCLMWVEEECIQIGYIERVSENVYRAFNVVRGALATTRKPHAAATSFYYTDTMPLKVRDARLQPYLETYFKVNPLGTNGATEAGTPFLMFHEGQYNTKFVAVGNKPLSPVAIEYKDSTDLAFPGKQISFKPRHYHKGAGTGPFFENIRDLVGNVETMEFAIQQVRSDGVMCVDEEGDSWQAARVLNQLDTRMPVKVVFVPGNMKNSRSGMVTAYGIQLEADCAEIRLFTYLAGQRSVEYASFFV